MTDSAEVAVNQHTIFTTSFTGLKAVRTSRKTWSGSATFATWPSTEAVQTWDKGGLRFAPAWQRGSWVSSFGRTWQPLFLSDGSVRIVAVGDAIDLE